MTWVLIGVLVLWVCQTMIPPVLRLLFNPDAPSAADALKLGLGPRDRLPRETVMGGRARRAQANLMEALPVFLGLLLALEHTGAWNDAVTGGWIFLGARALYVPAYLVGPAGLRSCCWAASWVGLGEMAASLL